MVEFLICYFVFAITTSIVCYINLVGPVLKRLKAERPLSDISQSPLLSIMVFILIGVIIAPIVFIPSIVPKHALVFQDALFETLAE